MNKFFFILSHILLISTTSTFSQSVVSDLIPVDKAIKIGKLKNGFTYYLKKTNSKKVEIHFVVKAGGNHETTNQKELAHLIEHMPFGGTKNFKDPMVAMRQYGLSFGGNVNASTGASFTWFKANVQANNPEVLRFMLQFYRDCAHDIDRSPQKIENARAAVLEEIRMSSSTTVNDSINMILLGENKYRKYYSTSSKESIINLKYPALLSFYDRYYRSNLQALIVVGDFDVLQTEKYIGQLYSGLIPSKIKTTNIETRDTSVFNWRNQFVILRDKTLSRPIIDLFFKRPSRVLKTKSDLNLLLIEKLFDIMVQARYKALTLEGKIKFASGLVSTYTKSPMMGPKFDLINTQCSFTNKDAPYAYRELLIELERLKSFGFSDPELAQAKLIIRDSELFKEVNDFELVNKLKENFTFGDTFLNPLIHGNLISEAIESISLENINREIKAWLATKNNLDIIYRLPISESKPFLTEKMAKEITNNVKALKLSPYVMKPLPLVVFATDLVNSQELDSLQKKLKGIYFKHREDKSSGLVKINFTNGIEVLLKPLNGESNKRVVIKSVNSIEKHTLSDSERFINNNAAFIVSQSGLGLLDNSGLSNFYSQSKIESLTPYIYEKDFGFNGTFDAPNFERVLQAIYLYSVKPKIDSNVVRNFIAASKSSMQNYKRHPVIMIEDTINYLHGKDRSYVKPSIVEIENLTSGVILDHFKSKFSVTENSKFVFVGDFAIDDKLLTLIVKYLGNIPKQKTGSNITEKPLSTKINSSPPYHVVIEGVDPKISVVFLELEGFYKASASNKVVLGLIQKKLNNVLFDILRVKERGTYVANVGLNLKRDSNTFAINISFRCAPENVDRLISSTIDEIKNVDKSINAVDIDALKQLRKNELATKLLSTDFIVSNMLEEVRNPKSFVSITEELRIVEEITEDDLISFIKQYFKSATISSYIINPKKASK